LKELGEMPATNTSHPAEKLLFATNVTVEPLPVAFVTVARIPWFI